jgi:hypothetical protein
MGLGDANTFDVGRRSRHSVHSLGGRNAQTLMTDAEQIASACALASVAIALWSLKVARRAERVAREDVILTDARERRGAIADHLQKYGDLLMDVRDGTKAAKLEIKNSADDVLKRLYHLIDDFAVGGSPRYSRHLFHEMSEQVFESFLPELRYQYVENILMRYAGVRRRLREASDACRQLPKPTEPSNAVLNALARWLRRPTAPRGYTPEQRMMSSTDFLETYRELDSRFDRGSGRRLLLASLGHIEAFCETQRRLRPVLQSAHEPLVMALDRNSAEEYKVHESPELWSKIQGEMRALGLMARLDLGDMAYLNDHDVAEAVPEIVHAGSVLYTMTMVADRSRYSSEPMT